VLVIKVGEVLCIRIYWSRFRSGRDLGVTPAAHRLLLADYFIQGKIVDTNVTKNNKNSNMNVNDNIWEENTTNFEYVDEKPEEEEQGKKKPMGGWGDT